MKALDRSNGRGTEAVRREGLFYLAVGARLHGAINLRGTLYPLEVDAPRVSSLREAADEESEALFEEVGRILDNSVSRLGEVVSEVRALLVKTRDQLRRLLVERAGDRVVTHCLLRPREKVGATFPQGFAGVIEALPDDPWGRPGAGAAPPGR